MSQLSTKAAKRWSIPAITHTIRTNQWIWNSLLISCALWEQAESFSARGAALVRGCDLRKRHVENWVSLPVFVVEVPPLLRMHGEAFGFHCAS